jgi:hypothetical protein
MSWSSLPGMPPPWTIIQTANMAARINHVMIGVCSVGFWSEMGIIIRLLVAGCWYWLLVTSCWCWQLHDLQPETSTSNQYQQPGRPGNPRGSGRHFVAS